MSVETPEPEAARWRSEALLADRRADLARELAIDIERRRIELHVRLDPVKSRHRPEVWSSGVAEVSRTLLVRGVGLEIWNARDRLLATRVALERQADELAQTARSHRHRAAVIDAGVEQAGDSSSRVF